MGDLSFLDVDFPPDPDKPFDELSDRELLLDNASRMYAFNHWHHGVNRALVSLIDGHAREKWVVRILAVITILSTWALHFIPGPK